MSRMIYIVARVAGQYEDRREHIVRAFARKEDADHFATRAQAQGRETARALYMRRLETDNWSLNAKRWMARQGIKLLDPTIDPGDVDNEHVGYWVEQHELVE